MGVGKRTKPMGDGCCQFSTVGRSCFGGAGKTPTMQKVWLTALRHLIELFGLRLRSLLGLG